MLHLDKPAGQQQEESFQAAVVAEHSVPPGFLLGVIGMDPQPGIVSSFLNFPWAQLATMYVYCYCHLISSRFVFRTTRLVYVKAEPAAMAFVLHHVLVCKNLLKMTIIFNLASLD